MMVKNCGQWILTENQCRGENMTVCYKKLWKLLIDKKMKKSALTELADVSSSTIAKLNRDEYVSLEVLERICRALRCDIGDVVELTEESEK